MEQPSFLALPNVHLLHLSRYNTAKRWLIATLDLEIYFELKPKRGKLERKEKKDNSIK